VENGLLAKLQRLIKESFDGERLGGQVLGALYTMLIGSRGPWTNFP
jgi:hypothetical protein